MKNPNVRRSSAAKEIFGTVLAAGLIFGPTIASAYVDEGLIEGEPGEGEWFVAPSGDSERDADTLQYVVDSANAGDAIKLRSGTFDFSAVSNGDPDDEKAVTVAKKLQIIGQATTNAFGVVEEYHTIIKGSRNPFIVASQDATLEGIYVEVPGADDYAYPPEIKADGVMLNMSIRLPLSDGKVAIPGLVISGGKRLMMFRAVGPSLDVFDVENVMGNPSLELYRGGELVTSSCDWCDCADNGAAAKKGCELVGAFPLPEGSLDAVIVAMLNPGAYTLMVQDEDGLSGEVLIEMYSIPLD